jgi:uncharacterized protein YkwD
MRTARAVLVCLFALAFSGCLVQGSGSKAFDAIASATAAGAVTVANEVERQKAARDAERSRERDNPCPVWECYAATDMTLEDARNYALKYINHARADAGLPPLALDYVLNDFAQAGSRQLAQDHQPHEHLSSERRACPICAETQGDPAGLEAASVHDQLDAALAFMLSEGNGGPDHDVLLNGDWHRVGVGIVNPDARMYFTVDVAP